MSDQSRREMGGSAGSDLRFGYNDPEQVRKLSAKGVRNLPWIVLALVMLVLVWGWLDYALLMGDDWISPTYDHEDWRTNEGGLHTFGAWDIETHVWKTMFLMENFPNADWNPYWYLGMPLMKYYPIGFFPVHALVTMVMGVSAARAALLLVMFGHLAAAMLTFAVCYKVSRRAGVAGFSAVFVLANTFISLRSYGWEPIPVVFLFLYPLGLLLYLREPLRPFRFWVAVGVALSYLMHPLIWFSLLMFMGLYLLTVLARRYSHERAVSASPLYGYLGLVAVSVLLGAVQFFPQITYEQVTSGSHMGVKYLPFYQVPYNIITPQDFLFDALNLKGPGQVVLLALLLLVVLLAANAWKSKKTQRGDADDQASGESPSRSLWENHLVRGIAVVLGMMITFYYLEL